MRKTGEFKDRLNEALEMRDWKPSDLVRETGISAATISQYRSGYSKPKEKRLGKIAEVLHVNPAWLMGLDVDMNGKAIRNEQPIKMFAGARIPILGRIPCGIPMTVQEYADADDWVEIEESLAKTGEYYAIRANGDSMIPRINDGDIMIVHQQSEVESGQVAIVRVNGYEETCKRIRMHRDGIELIPINPNYETVFYDKKEIEDLPVNIVGRVIEIRSFL